MIKKDDVEVMSRGADGSMDVLVSPEELSGVLKELKLAGARVNVVHNNVANFLDEVDDLLTCDLHREKRGTKFNFPRFFKCYHSVDEQYTFLQELAKANPNKAETFSIGKSFQGQDLLAVRISNNLKSSHNKPMIWIDGGIHAREWIASTTALWIAGALLGEVDTLSVNHLLDTYQFVILPMSNPDGYRYSRMSRFTRFWRKTRRPSGCKATWPLQKLCDLEQFWCKGIDPNRNFDAAFGTAGTTNDVCADTFPGDEAFSEKNTQAMRDFILANKNKLKLYLSYHSFAQVFLKPTGYKFTFFPNSGVHETAGIAYTKAVEATHGYEYQTMTSMEFYPNSGSSADWVYLQGVVNSYSVELRGKIDGKHLWFLPKKEIQPCGEENFRGLVALVEQLNYSSASYSFN